jgi:peptidoglycan/xylan/chitin deacetylase (PgdA/CDA1 family)
MMGKRGRCWRSLTRALTACVAIGAAVMVLLPETGATSGTVSMPAGLISAGPAHAPTVALIFDGGPGPDTTAYIDALHALYVPATFFFVGDEVQVNPAPARAALRAGDELGNMTYSNRDLQSLSTPRVVAEIARAQAAIQQAVGRSPRWFQPPYADVDARITSIAASMAMRPVVWSVNSYDLTATTSTSIAHAVLAHQTNGSIILFHDDGANAPMGIAALRVIVNTFEHRGYRFGTLDQLFGIASLLSCVPNPGGIFAAAGIRAVPGGIYNFWLNQLCRGIKYGPATSVVTKDAQGVKSQDFATRGRQIVESPTNGQLRVVLEWSWGTKDFSSHGVKPKYGDPITKAWFARFFAGTNEGSALTREQTFGHITAQQFEHGWALESSRGSVTWPKAYTPPPTPTPTPRPKPSPTPTRRPKPKPTATATPTVTPTKTPTRKPSP